MGQLKSDGRCSALSPVSPVGVWLFVRLERNPESKCEVGEKKPNVSEVEEKSGKLYGFEFKWLNKGKARLPATFLNAYKAEPTVIDRKNFRDFVIKPTAKSQ